MNKKLLGFLITKLWSIIIVVSIFFIIPFFRSLKFNDETEISTVPHGCPAGLARPGQKSADLSRPVPCSPLSEMEKGRHQWKDLQKDKSLNLKNSRLKSFENIEI